MQRDLLPEEMIRANRWCAAAYRIVGLAPTHCRVERANLEIATAEYIDWFNHRRLHGEIRTIPPTEYETNYYAQNTATRTVEASVTSLH